MRPGDPGQEALPTLPRDDEGPVFAEPWQAQAFAMAVRLHEQGHYSWPEWATELAKQIASGGPDDTTDYYEHWLATLEVMVAATGLSSEPELDERRDAWRQAASVTPHGQPILCPPTTRAGRPRSMGSHTPLEKVLRRPRRPLRS